jgi:hypothetical protein
MGADMISLTDEQLDAVLAAARPLAVEDRDPFIRAIAHELEQHNGSIGPGTVHRCIRDVQKRFFDPPDFTGSAGIGKWDRISRASR